MMKSGFLTWTAWWMVIPVALCREFSKRRGLGRQGSSVLFVSKYGHLGGWVLYADECASLHFWREMHRKTGLVIFFNSYFDELWILRHSFYQKKLSHRNLRTKIMLRMWKKGEKYQSKPYK